MTWELLGTASTLDKARAQACAYLCGEYTLAGNGPRPFEWAVVDTYGVAKKNLRVILTPKGRYRFERTVIK